MKFLPTRESLKIIALLIVIVGSAFMHANATEYVKPKPLYHHYPKDPSASSLWQPRSAALKADIIAQCMAQYSTSLSCTFEFGDEVWVSGSDWDRWRYFGTRVWVYQNPGYPAQTIVLDNVSFGEIHNYCPAGWSYSPRTPICYRDNSEDPDCEDCKRNTPPAARPPSVGNPIFPWKQIKQEVKVDYQNVQGTLQFIRTYRSDLNRWSNNYQMSVIDLNAGTSPEKLPEGACFLERNPSPLGRYCYPYVAVGNTNDVALRRGNQRARYFNSSSDFSTTPDIRDRITPILAADGSRNGWAVKNGDTEAIETYNASGFLISSTALNGQTTTFAYSDATTPVNVAPRAGLLLQVTDAFGAALSFSYDALGQLAQMSDPAGGIYIYVYDTENRLQSVTYPDGKRIQYLYNETGKAPSQMSTALTGIIDENGGRYATFTYNGSFMAATTEHAGGVNKYSLNTQYSAQTSVVDPLGTTHYYNYNAIQFGIKRYTGEQQPSPTGSGNVSKTITYDANANVASVTDFNGSKTTYTWNLTRNLETSRIEGVGTTAARTISTEWHPTLELRTRVAEPKRLTVYTYDENGNLLSQTVRATTDVNGTTGFNATLTGTPQTWTYTYNAQGQRLTAKGPRNDINDTTSYTYDMAGNLTSITNGAGHVTTLSDYDPHGHVGKITAANGLETTFSYTPRGWLSSSNVGGETTSYTYDGVGQLTGVTLPDNSTVSYTYDPAHRLTAISDSAGNSIAYTLDNMGNRTGEQVKDATGALARQISRAYDPLNKLKTVTGAAQ